MKNWISAWKAMMSANDTADPIAGRLARSKPTLEAPPDLHETIMSALRSRPAPGRRGQAESAPKRVLLLRMAASACLLALLATAAVWLKGPESAGTNESSVPSTIALAPQMTPEFEVLTGIEREMESLNSDLRHTAEHLLASIP